MVRGPNQFWEKGVERQPGTGCAALEPARIRRYIRTSLTFGWREEESLIVERNSGRLVSHRRSRAFLIAFALACIAFLFPWEGTTHAAALISL